MITLYTTHCPKCKILQSKLDAKNIEYTIIDDADAVINFGKEVGILSAPILDSDGIVFNYTRAINWVNNK